MSEEKGGAETAGPKAVLRDAGAKAREAVAKAREAGADAREGIGQGIEQARRKSRDVIVATREKSEAVIDDTREKTLRAAAETNRLFQEHPIAAVAAAAAAGAIVGIFLPRFNITSRVGKLAGSTVKAAVASGAAQRLLPGTRAASKPARPDTDEEG